MTRPDCQHAEATDPRRIGRCVKCGAEMPARRALRVYIAGPMTGIPQFNFPAFDAAAERLRRMGHKVFSPSEMDDPETRRLALASPDGSPGSGTANGETWGDFLARDVKLIADASLDAVAVLPGWQRSRGARLETFIARMDGIAVVWAADLEPVSTEMLDHAHTGRI